MSERNKEMLPGIMMTEKNRKKLSFLILFVCWLPQIKFLLPIPTMNVAEHISSFATETFSRSPEIVDMGVLDKENYRTDRIYHNLWLHWLFKASLIVMGLSTGIIIYKNIYMWHILAISASAAYLAVWYLTGSTASVPLIQSYKLKFQLAEAYNQYGSFAYKDVLLPLIFSCVILLLSYDLFSNLKGSK